MLRASFGLLVLLMMSSLSRANVSLDEIRLPKGFKIESVADVPGARSLAIADDGTIYVGSGGLGSSTQKVYRVKDGKTEVIAEKLNSPNGVALYKEDLYVAEIGRILKFPKVAQQKGPRAKYEVLKISFPDRAHHGWKFIRFNKKGELFVPVGAPCNVCDPGTEFARIYKVDLGTMTKTVFAEGVRNTVGFDFHPVTQKLWFTDNGRDWLGDDIPPEELNHASKEGLHFGFPHCHGGYIVDNEFKHANGCKGFTAPALKLPAHVAPLGMRFYTGRQFPKQYRGQIFIAEHGSWNRSKPQGYRVSLVKFRGDNGLTYEVFADGWLKNGSKQGRPVDVEIAPDGTLLVSDDLAGKIYRISYEE